MIDIEFWYSSFSGRTSRRDAVCRIRIFGNVVIASELAKNQGKSITNAIPELAQVVADRFNLNRQKMVWIEHYNADSYKVGG